MYSSSPFRTIVQLASCLFEIGKLVLPLGEDSPGMKNSSEKMSATKAKLVLVIKLALPRAHPLLETVLRACAVTQTVNSRRGR